MKNKLCSIYIFSILFFLACSKEIEINVDEADPRIVVRSEITNKPDSVVPGPGVILPQLVPARLTLGMSSSVYNSPIDNIVDAKIVLRKNSVIYDTILYNYSKSYYELFDSEQNMPKPGDSLFIEILHNGKKVTSISKMPSKVDIVSIDTSVFFSHFIEGSGAYAEAVIEFNDPGLEENYYELVVCMPGLNNGQLIPRYIRTDESFITSENHYPSALGMNQEEFNITSLLFTDKTFNGNQKSVRFYYNIGGTIIQDSIEIPHVQVGYYLRNVTKDYYLFHTSKKTHILNNNENILFGASEPQTVLSNIENGLGLFGLYSHDQKIYFFPKRTIKLP